MHRSLTPAALCAIAVALTSCSHAENYRWSARSNPHFTSDLSPPKSGEYGSWATPDITVYSFPAPPTTAADTNLKDLSDRGQAALIAALTKPGAKPDDIRDMLAKPLKSKAATQDNLTNIEGVFKRTLVANVTKGWNAQPGDRLVWTWVYIEPLNFKFDNYTVVATDTQVLNVEQVTNATTANATAQLGNTSSNTIGSTTTASPLTSTLSRVLGTSAGISGSIGNTYTTTATINQQYVRLGADILPDGLRIYRESERNLDVAGNTLIALTIKVDPRRITDNSFRAAQRVTAMELLDKNRGFAAPAAVKLDVELNRAPPPCPLVANVTLFYQIRRVRNGRSYVEGQQQADYVAARSRPRQVTLVSRDELVTPTWRIETAYGEQTLHARNGINDQPLEFTSYDQASAFAAWFNAHRSVYAGKSSLAVGKGRLLLWSGMAREALRAAPFHAQPFAPSSECPGVDLQINPIEAAMMAPPVPPRRR